MSYRSPSLAAVIATLEVERRDDHHFVATQLDNPAHHIVGGHIAGQALMAASMTAPGRTPHSLHVYYVRARRRPVSGGSAHRPSATSPAPARCYRFKSN